MQTHPAPDAPTTFRSPLEAAFASQDADTGSMVARALAEKRARLAFQPVVLMRDTRQVSFHEGLLRLNDDQGRIINAGQFIDEVIDTDVGRRIDCLALELTLQMLRERPDLRLSVNVSARSFGDWRWRTTLHDALSQAGHLGDRLILEISEGSAMLLPEIVTRFMADVQPLGVCFALDGYGGGALSFKHLSNFYFDLVKIDRYFTRRITRAPDHQAIVAALVSVARQFEMFVVADGVEHKEDAAFLRTYEIDCLQGYLTGRPQFKLQ
ncbi:EAL domain-containing protein [Salipiger sp. IMCC34102]|uniref:EAL domain-containing protein n=1 Tax=Salipiger sp. IMCC34102 TaxID=2510647 RepID=UPI00101B8D39|nr:EAL domain-containing protein [Salipiger sp. IMCC34102]RYH01996.1 EAL domain-containing protein [Salipiger sp. IMCC34102]